MDHRGPARLCLIHHHCILFAALIHATILRKSALGAKFTSIEVLELDLSGARLSERPVVEFDLRAFKTHTRDWQAALERAVRVRVDHSPGVAPFLLLSSALPELQKYFHVRGGVPLE